MFLRRDYPVYLWDGPVGLVPEPSFFSIFFKVKFVGYVPLKKKLTTGNRESDEQIGAAKEHHTYPIIGTKGISTPGTLGLQT